ncbi:MAG: hypothetical protein TREMPRED_004671 [Tremellales sp. Tagirdzhanova-0007]|nr:MAG: hypothetical protein TREMPRED_004671 [Tremellales sp. Tagirdzhanova-0007]
MSESKASGSVLWQAFTMIIVSELGDKTFLLAAVMAYRHPRIIVFGGAFASLVVMTIIAVIAGKIVLGLIPKVWLLWSSAALYTACGFKMILEARNASPTGMAQELREAEEELSMGPLMGTKSLLPLTSVNGTHHDTLPAAFSSSLDRHPSGTLRSVLSRLNAVGALGKRALKDALDPVFVQAFVLTTASEIGDRSQIATVSMAGTHNIFVIAFGVILGHGLCTAAAVMGGRYLSTKISVKHFTLLGSFAFLLFGLLSAVEAYHTEPAATGDVYST